MNYLNITKWLLQATLTGSMLALLILVVKKTLGKKLSVNLHYYIWVLLLIKLIVPFGPESKASIYNIIQPSYSSSFILNTYDNQAKSADINLDQTEFKEITINDISTDNDVLAAKSIPDIKKSHSRIDYKYIFFIAWILGMAAYASYTLVGTLRVRKIIAYSTKVSEEINNIFNEAKHITNIRSKVNLGVSDQISSPSLFGIFNPTIIIPSAVIERLSISELRYIFIHELCHVKRKDILISWLKITFKTIHWFNPLIIFGLNQIEKDCEVSCDAKALSYLDNSENKAYGNTILNVLKLVNKPAMFPGSTSIIISKKDLKRRISLIANSGRISVNTVVIGVVIVLIIAVVGLTGKISLAEASNQASPSKILEAGQAYIQKNSSVTIDKTATDNEVTVTLKEMAYDGAAFYITYQLHEEMPFDKYRAEYTMSVNGDSYKRNGTIEIKKIDSNTVQFTEMVLINSEDKLPEKLNISLKFSEVIWKNGNWEFNIALDKDELTRNSKWKDLNKEIQFSYAKVKIASLTKISTFATLVVDYDDLKDYKDPKAFSLLNDAENELQQQLMPIIIRKGNKAEAIFFYKVTKNTKINKLVVNETDNVHPYPGNIKNMTYVEFNDSFPKTISVGNGKEIIINKSGLDEEAYKTLYGTLSPGSLPTLSISAKGLSMQDYVSNGGITLYNRKKDAKNQGSYTFGITNVKDNNNYEIWFNNNTLNVQAPSEVLVFAQYDEVLKPVVEVNLD